MKVRCFTLKKCGSCGNRSFKSRSFLLLEVIIALTIVSLVAFPLITPHVWMIIEEKGLNQDIEMDRHLNLIWANLVEKLYKNEFAWQDIATGQKEIPLDTGAINDLPEPWPYTVTFISNSRKEKKGKTAGQTYNLMEIRFLLKDAGGKIITTNPYNLFLERKIPISKEEAQVQQEKSKSEEPPPPETDILEEPPMEEVFE